LDITGFPTSISALNVLLSVLVASIRELLGDQFVGFILHGSLTNDDFVPNRSDIDFVVVTATEMPTSLLERLMVMHARIREKGMKWTDKLEGSYIPVKALRRYDPANAVHPALRVDGSFGIDRHGIDWVIQRRAIRDNGIALAGPAPRSLVAPVSSVDLRHAARGTLREWWVPQLDDFSRLCNREYQAYAVLTMCRVMYTNRFGTVVSKSHAVQWAQSTLAQCYVSLIASAAVWPEGAQPDQLEDTLDFIRFTLASCDT
jgi:predicted nucleotidyltransferase